MLSVELEWENFNVAVPFLASRRQKKTSSKIKISRVIFLSKFSFYASSVIIALIIKSLYHWRRRRILVEQVQLITSTPISSSFSLSRLCVIAR